ncbi:exopolyphosphatase [Novosphingobium sp. FSY-8]|uniref:Exopolyphosphatase n=1 Tax=Novosphingobium ovatum TaxID=1908523 RepID=A0ABW9XEA3_9SPHN|nr:Ppx/GppA family phosphatase [Novosphingobium ovatum]NBC36873.1 exopolyphosphatase [Novosphingobium ovatum]
MPRSSARSALAAASVTPITPRGVDVATNKAIIDIGSNTVRMVIYGRPARAPVVLFNEKVTARLGKGVAETGRLSAKGMANALATLSRFALLLRLRGIVDVECVATAASRDAENGAEFLDKVRELGLSPRLLSGEEEAVASAHGVQAAFPGAAGIVADLGGGSLELIDVIDGRCTHGVTLPLGTLRLPALRADGDAKFLRRVRAMLAGADWTGDHGQTLYLVGGSLRAFARFAMVERDWPVDDPHGYEMTAAQVLDTVRVLRARQRRAEGLAPIPGVSASRMGSLLDAGALLAVLVRELAPARVVFSGWGLREGLLAGSMDAQVARTNPLLAGVSAFVETQEPGMAAMAARIAGWVAPVCGIDPPVEGGCGESLRRAATMLALASLRTEPNMRAQQAEQWALRKRWVGLDAAGRAMIAAAVLANNGRAEWPPYLERLAGVESLRQARVWGQAVRMARRFCGGVVEALDGAQLRLEDGAVVLQVAASHAPLCTDATAKDIKALAELLGVKSRIDMVD